MKYLLTICVVLFVACSTQNKKLPYLGNFTEVNGSKVYDTVAPFTFTSQDSTLVTNTTFNNKVYVADFIFLSCPSMCPIMTTNLKTVYNQYKNNPNVLFLSHTIDPEHDSVAKLKEYSNNLGVNSNQWLFVTGAKDSIYQIAEKSYYATTYEDFSTKDIYVHSGGLILVDQNSHVRGIYNGTNPDEVALLVKDIALLLQPAENN